MMDCIRKAGGRPRASVPAPERLVFIGVKIRAFSERHIWYRSLVPNLPRWFMKSRICIGLLSCVFLTTSAMACDYDRARLLALDETQFDQYESGWRALASKPGCDLAAADLLRDYRQAHLDPPIGEGIPAVVNGYMEVDYADGQKRKMRWPPNIDIVECLARRFDKPYSEAYANECR
jgi:hypothetical protein